MVDVVEIESLIKEIWVPRDREGPEPGNDAFGR